MAEKSKQGGQQGAVACRLHPERALLTPSDTWIVSEKPIPAEAQEFAHLANARVCEDCAQMLRTLGFRVFNLQRARERAAEKRQAQATATIRDLLAAQGQAVPQAARR